ncbi:hypothetical protein PHYSODRAFT_299814 [Phytophthora sojae]|uniref:Ankyrin repeat-containing domain n=1 Tax=Phytophthora sojae (strain P6497) TaxID=1094619 RepID=G4Z9J2_PHYSP|nr:hypothetical protein PHYSODRAFT_299814 [Phytophthora sojae]EGZ22624.1 hypothetical protein PHYSODRAFT_299814 [Phytophthora sojae]|eukprot:XP_009525341.1 hypothetical protein PHYSODRAFT_299814 [Phytophthora sojae]
MGCTAFERHSTFSLDKKKNSMEVAPLLVVRLALRDKLKFNVPDGVGIAISDLLVEDMPLSRGCQLSHPGSTLLLEFIWSRGLRILESDNWSPARLLQVEPHYFRWELTQAMAAAVRHGDMNHFEWILDRYSGCPVYQEVLNETCREGGLEILQLLERADNTGGLQWGNLLLNWAVDCGHWDLIHWVESRLPHRAARGLTSAFQQSYFEETKRLTAHGYEMHASIDESPAYYEETWPTCKEIVRYLLPRIYGQLNTEQLIGAALHTAAEADDLEFIRWLIDRPVESPQLVYRPAFVLRL